jgi:FkbM family methyltransferase
MKNLFSGKPLTKLSPRNVFNPKLYYRKIEDILYRRKIEALWSNLHSHEAWLFNIIKESLENKPGAFIDVGVNIGQTLLKVKTINASNDYIGFEPNPTCCFYVNDLIKFNELKNCKLIPVGLSDKAAVVKLFKKSATDAAASLIEGFREQAFYSSEDYVPVFEGDYLLSLLNLEAISIIKIDVEGGEVEVIRGLRSSISKYQPYILCEILPVRDIGTELGSFRKERQDALEKILREENYKIYRILHNGEIIPLEQFEIHSDLSLCEYMFVPQKETKGNDSGGWLK